MSTPKLLSKQYVAEGGYRCPACGSDNIASGYIEADGATGYADVVCHDCKAEWVDVWELVGYDNLTTKGG